MCSQFLQWEDGGRQKSPGMWGFLHFSCLVFVPFLWKNCLKIFTQIFFSSEQVLVVCTYHPSFWGWSSVGGGRIQVPGQPGQVREPLSKTWKTRTKCCSMAENLQGICETLHSVLKMTKKSECILKLLSLLFLVQRLEPKFLYLLSRQTLFQ